jgi:cell division initiation protein
MKITPLDIEKQQFKLGFRGYSTADVDAFLGLVAREYEALTRENIEFRDELKRRTTQIEEFRAREEALKDTMVTAQKATQDIKESAKKEADLIIAQAEFHAEKVISAAQERKTKVIYEINELKRQRIQWLAHLEGMIEAHRKLLEIQKTDTNTIPGMESVPPGK